MSIGSIGVTATGIIVTTIVTGLITSMISGFKTFYLLKQAMQFLIQDRIVQAHNHFTDKGSISKFSLQSIENLFKVYKLLKGNGFVEELMKDIRALPMH